MQSVDRAFLLLGLVAASGDDVVGISELARRSGLAKSTTARLVNALREQGALEDHTTNGLRIGPTIGALWNGAGGAPDLLRQVARPVLASLSDVIGEHACLAVASGGQVEYIDQVSSEVVVDAGDWTGVRHPPHLAAVGQVLMLDWSPARLSRYLGSGLSPATEHSITEPDEMRRRLAEIDERGAAWSVDEYSLDVTGCAAPILDPDGEIVGAVGVFAPSYRFPSEVGAELVEREVVEAAAEISALIGAERAA